MKTENKMMGPLAGITVIDFGHYYAGPLVGMLMADQGADVIHVVKPLERQTSDAQRPTRETVHSHELPEQQFRLLNRNKKLLTLDLKTEEGKAQALSLIAKADVLIENFRPGVMQRLELDYASVKGLNPGLIYLSLPGFASTDKKRAHIPAWEGVLSAAIGLYTEMHAHRKPLGYPPVYSWLPASSVYGALQGMTATLSALLAREEFGVGTLIETPLAEAGLSSVAGLFTADWKPSFPTKHRTAQDHDQPPIPAEIPESLRPYAYHPEDSRETQIRKLADVLRDQYMFDPCNYFHKCADGRYIIIFCTTNPALTERLLKALGLFSQLQREGFVCVGLWQQNLDNDLAKFYSMNAERRERYSTLMKELFLTKTAEEWETALAEVAPVALIRTRAEFLALKPLLESGVLAQMNDGASTLTVPGRFVEVTGPGGQLMDSFREAAVIDVDRAEQSLSRSAGDRAYTSAVSLKKSDLLKSLKVLDLSDGVAGPASSYNLSQYGASVIKLDNPFTPYPGGSNALDFYQGKRIILANLKTAPGQKILRQLVRWADLVIHNNLDDVCENLGVTQEQLREINPKVVSCQLTSLGGSRRGGWELRSGWEPIPMAVTGTMARYGTLEVPQVHGYGVIGDFTGGLSLAISGLLAVWQQRKTGYAGEARASLAKCCSYIQLPYMIEENGNSDWGEDHGQFATGDHYYQRMYECSDGWIYVGTTENRADILCETVAGSADAGEETLGVSFFEQGSDYWQEKLSAVDIGCHKVMTIDEVFSQIPLQHVKAESADARIEGVGELLCIDDHPCGKPIIIKASDWVRVGEEKSYMRMMPAMTYGHHTREILEELGYGEAEIDKLIRLKIVHEKMPGMHAKGVYFFDPKVDGFR